MDDSGLAETMDTSSDPEQLAVSDSDGDDDRSSVDVEPNNGLDICCDIIEKFDQGIGPWIFEVLTCAFSDGEEEVGAVHAYFIKKEEIQVQDYNNDDEDDKKKKKKKSLRKALKDEGRLLNVMFEFPKIFQPRGHVSPEYLLHLSGCFTAIDMKAFEDTNDATEHPANHAWILLIRDIVVDPKYRRLGIGGNMIRKTLETVLAHCAVAARPLLVAVQPKRIDEYTDEEWSQIFEMRYHYHVNQVFWEEIGFARYEDEFCGFTAPWFFWGTSLSLPPEKSITIPDDLDERNTRTATPPLPSPIPIDRTKPTPFDFFPVFDEVEFEPPVVAPSEGVFPSHIPAAPENKSSVPGNVAAETGRWFDNPDDPSLHPQDAQTIRDLMRVLDAVGKKYQVRPLKEPAAAQPTSPERKCPFKALSGAKPPRPMWPSRAPSPKPPVPETFQRTAAPKRSPSTAARQSAPNEPFSEQPGSRFLVTIEDDDESGVDDVDPDDLKGYSYEELVACGYINGDEDDQDDEDDREETV